MYAIVFELQDSRPLRHQEFGRAAKVALDVYLGFFSFSTIKREGKAVILLAKYLARFFFLICSLFIAQVLHQGHEGQHRL